VIFLYIANISEFHSITQLIFFPAVAGEPEQHAVSRRVGPVLRPPLSPRCHVPPGARVAARR